MIITMSKGQQITIPAKIREEFKLGVGSKIEIEEKAGKIILKPIIEDLEKIFEETKNIKPKHRLSAEQMDELNERVMAKWIF